MESREMAEDNHDLEIPTPSESNLSLKTEQPKIIERGHRKTSAEMLYEDQPHKKRVTIRLVVFVVCLSFLFIGRYSVPSNQIQHIRDIPMEWFDKFNAFIQQNHAWRNALQIICSLFMDVMFLGSGAFWILRGNTSRLVVATLFFYIIRAIVQALFWLPFPVNGYYWWDDPGFPSFVVPYGVGSDFFFSGHIGFVTICACEWKKAGIMPVYWGLVIGGAYTAFILLAYHVHYSIDLFTGVFFAHWCYQFIDANKDSVDSALINIFYKGKMIFKKGLKIIRGDESFRNLF